MSLGKPNLYIGTTLMQSTAAGTTPALAGLTIRWGTDSRIEFDPAATLTGHLLVRAAMPSYLMVGTAVGVTDPATGRCLFAGHIATLTAAPDERISAAMRVTFTAASPLADLTNHDVFDFDWPIESTAARRSKLAGSIARGWTLQGLTGLAGYQSGRLKFQSQNWLTLAEWYCRSNTYRMHDTSAYVPGAGLAKRMTFTNERDKGAPDPNAGYGTGGVWHTGANKPGSATGLAILPASVIGRGLEWEKTPDDTVTDVKVSTWGQAVIAADAESQQFDYLMDVYVDNTAMQNKYGFRQISIETDLHSDPALVPGRISGISTYWLDADTQWRPTGLNIPDSRKVDTAALLNLLAVDTRHMAALAVPAGSTPATLPGKVHSYVMAGEATWTGKKWTADLTLGRTLD